MNNRNTHSSISLPEISKLPVPPKGSKGWPWTVSAGVPHDAQLPENCPRISIVTPSFNQGEFIEATIRSVLLQGYPDLEYIIIDGGSTDNTLEIITKYQQWITCWISELDHGQSEAINKGFSLSSGKWLGWLNSDDIYLPDTLKHLASVFETNPDCHWIAGTTLYTNKNLSKVLGHFRPKISNGEWRKNTNDVNRWIDFMCSAKSDTALPQPSSFWSKHAFEKAGKLDESLHFAMDHEYYVRLSKCGLEPVLSDMAFSSFRLHEKSKTAKGQINFLHETMVILDKQMAHSTDAEKRILNKYRAYLQRKINTTEHPGFLSNFSDRFPRVQAVFGLIWLNVYRLFRKAF